jgi:enoyl-CoA hydratase
VIISCKELEIPESTEAARRRIMDYMNILVEKKESVAIIKINRPAVMNALNTETLTELQECMKEMGAEPSVKVIIITGEGKAFVAGADNAEKKDMTPEEAYRFSVF